MSRVAERGPAGRLRDCQLRRDALPKVGDMADDADDATTVPQVVDDGHHLVEGVVVERTEPFIDEQRLEPGTARLSSGHIGEAERERERGEEALPTGQRRRWSLVPSPAIDDGETETGPPAVTVAVVGVHE